MAWLVPLIVAGAGMVAQNQANHSAQAANSAQQDKAIANSKEAFDRASTALQPWLAPGAAPYSKDQIGRPTPSFAQAYQPRNVNAMDAFRPAPLQSPGQQGGMNPALLQMLFKLISGLHQQAPPPPAVTPKPAGIPNVVAPAVGGDGPGAQPGSGAQGAFHDRAMRHYEDR